MLCLLLSYERSWDSTWLRWRLFSSCKESISPMTRSRQKNTCRDTKPSWDQSGGWNTLNRRSRASTEFETLSAGLRGSGAFAAEVSRYTNSRGRSKSPGEEKPQELCAAQVQRHGRDGLRSRVWILSGHPVHPFAQGRDRWAESEPPPSRRPACSRAPGHTQHLQQAETPAPSALPLEQHRSPVAVILPDHSREGLTKPRGLCPLQPLRTRAQLTVTQSLTSLGTARYLSPTGTTSLLVSGLSQLGGASTPHTRALRAPQSPQQRPALKELSPLLTYDTPLLFHLLLNIIRIKNYF